MNDVLAMNVVDSRCDTRGDTGDLFVAERQIRQALQERLSFNVLHDDVRLDGEVADSNESRNVPA